MTAPTTAGLVEALTGRETYELWHTLWGSVGSSQSFYSLSDSTQKHWNNFAAEISRRAIAAYQAQSAVPAPIDMVLFCPACGEQHIDAPAPVEHGEEGRIISWTNPPHRSHLCHACGHVWRPADVPTNGVSAVKTAGKNDSPMAAELPATPEVPAPGGEFVLVPRKPTEAMLKPYRGLNRTRDTSTLARSIWSYMLAAAPPAPAASGWRTMESAPKNTPLLVYRGASDDPEVSVGVWEAGLSWIFFIGSGVCQYGRPPTHWQPLPSPPDTAQGEG